MGWSDAPRLHYLADVVVRPKGPVFNVEVPFPHEQMLGKACSTVRDPDHVLLRPFEKWFRRSKPNAGRILYSILQVGSRSLVPFALSLTPHPSTLSSSSILPGTICVFPGFRRSMVHPEFGTVKLLHVTVRETGKKAAEVYSHCVTLGGERRRSRKRVKVETGTADFLHLVSSWYRTPDAVDNAGNAQLRIPPECMRAQPPRLGEIEWGQVFVDRLLVSEGMGKGPTYLRSILLLARRMPEEREMSEIVQFAVESEALAARNPVQSGLLTGAVLGASAIDLGAIGVSCEFPLFVHIRGVFQGKMNGNAGIAAFAGQLPTRRWFESLSPAAKEVLTRQARKSRRGVGKEQALDSA